MARAFGKIILAGEHSVVYGYPAIACPIPLIVDIDIRFSNNPGLYFHNKTFIPKDGSKLLFTRIFLKLVELLGRNVGFLEINVFNSIPNGYGLGSSAALSISLIRSIIIFLNTPRTSNDIASIAMEIEKIFHGNPSGIDHTTILEEKFIWFKNGNFEKINTQLEIEIVIVMSKSYGMTIKSIDHVSRLSNTQTKYTNNILESIANLTNQMRKAIELCNYLDIGYLMNENHRLLRALGVSNLELDYLCNVAISNGALGAKLTGAGGGGCIIIFAIKNTMKKLNKIFKNYGYNTFLLKYLSGIL